MKPTVPLTICIISSFRNTHAVRMLSDRLRADGHMIPDWTDNPLPENMLAHERRALLDADEHDDTFRFCAHSCASADLVIYLGQAGQDAACQVGMAYTSGVPVYGLRGMFEVPGLIMSKAVTRWFDNVDDLLDALYDDQPDCGGEK